MQLWNSDLKNGMYKNPILFTDYSDPDVIRVGNDFYMISSSFTYVPGVPVLHSKDLVNWEIINYCIKKIPFANYSQPCHGSGSWAPSLRYQNGWFYAFIPFPDEGIYITKTQDPYGEWSTLQPIKKGKGFIDPCPFWDEDGRAYMVYAFAKSRCGIKSKIAIAEMDVNAEKIVGMDNYVYDGTLSNPTIEGPKIYKKNGYYYIFAPAGGVKTGWQTVLRSKNIYGPYEEKIVLHQGNTKVNGPHQGGFVELEDEKCFFIHFQDCEEYGRIIHLQPMCWIDNWPFIGLEQNGDQIGEPVDTFEKPIKSHESTDYFIPTSDTFETERLGLQWQWQANPQEKWYSLTKKKGCLRLYAMSNEIGRENFIWYAPNVLTQILQAPSFQAEVCINIKNLLDKDKVGIGVLGHEYHAIAIAKINNLFELSLIHGDVLDIQMAGLATEVEDTYLKVRSKSIRFLIEFTKGGFFQLGYILENEEKILFEQIFKAKPATWTGAKIMLFCLNDANKQNGGYADLEYIKFNNTCNN